MRSYRCRRGRACRSFPFAVIFSGLAFILPFIAMVATVTVVTMIAAIAMVTTVPVITTAVAIAITRVGIRWRGHDGKGNNRRQCCLRVRRLSMMLIP